MCRLLAGLAALVLMLVGATGAAAATRHVAADGSDTTDCLDPAAPCASVVHAAAIAASGDTIQIGPGTFVGSVFTSGRSLSFVGSGPSTVIRGTTGPPNSSGLPGLTLDGSGAIRSLRVEGGAAGVASEPLGTPGGTAIFLSSLAPAGVAIESVEAAGGPGGASVVTGPGGTALWAQGPAPLTATVRDSAFEQGPGESLGAGTVIVGEGAVGDFSRVTISNGVGLNVANGGRATVAASSIAARVGAVVNHGSLLLSGSRLAGTLHGIQMASESGDPSSAEVVDSLVTSDLGEAAQLFSGGASGAAVSLAARGSTLIGRGGDAALTVFASEPGDGPVTTALHNSIVRDLRPDPSEPRLDLLAEKGVITATFSSFASSKALSGEAPVPGSGTNTAANPLFVDAAGGNFALQSTSPLIDRGDPALVQPGQLDLAGSPRSLDGDGNCLAAPDIGAFELTGHGIACPSDAPPTVSGFRLTNKAFAPKGKAHAKKRKRGRASASAKRRRRRAGRGTTFVYRLSEPAGVRITIERKARGRRVGKGRKARCVKPRRGKAKPRCVRFVKVGALSAQKKAGKGTTPFSGRLRGKPLRPGRYRATIVATDSAGQKSQPRRVSFRVVRG